MLNNPEQASYRPLSLRIKPLKLFFAFWEIFFQTDKEADKTKQKVLAIILKQE